ncbi:MAG TPA: disulfide bond formation protein DsbA [Gammaproteobacteria bacterium]|nr:disulfide bond formation protein DsbA [Gammaproteobacteria bacterium]
MPIKIEYFSDVLCIWAYAGQVRMDELKQHFSSEIDIEYRFVSIFGAGKQHVENVWKDEGGLAGFNAHLQQVAKNWDHVEVSPDLWLTVKPQSSTSAHLYLKAIQLLEKHNGTCSLSLDEYHGRSRFEQAIWLFRDAFFRQARDISHRRVQTEIAEQLGVDTQAVSELIDSGEAFAELHADDKARQNYNVPGSPTLVLNDGRQLLYGNVGYRIIDANIRELMHHPDEGEASWC